MLVSNIVVPDYVCLGDVAVDYPEPKPLDRQANAEVEKDDREIQRLLNNLTSAFSLGIDLFNSH